MESRKLFSLFVCVCFLCFKCVRIVSDWQRESDAGALLLRLILAIYCKNLRWKITMNSASSIDVDSQPVWVSGESTPTNAKELRTMESQHACIHFINGLTALLQERLGNMCQLLDVFTAQSSGTR